MTSRIIHTSQRVITLLALVAAFGSPPGVRAWAPEGETVCVDGDCPEPCVADDCPEPECVDGDCVVDCVADDCPEPQCVDDDCPEPCVGDDCPADQGANPYQLFGRVDLP
jgi:hypothetical protein